MMAVVGGFRFELMATVSIRLTCTWQLPVQCRALAVAASRVSQAETNVQACSTNSIKPAALRANSFCICTELVFTVLRHVARGGCGGECVWLLEPVISVELRYALCIAVVLQLWWC